MAENISDIIERYIKRILEESHNGVVELQRSELAELFQCVPSQINYVINTRFSVEHGYVVESKRGGGGYIRIRQMPVSSDDPVMDLLASIGDEIAQREAEGIIARLARDGWLTEREAMILRAVVSRDVLRIELPYRDALRARLLTQALAAALAAGPPKHRADHASQHRANTHSAAGSETADAAGRGHRGEPHGDRVEEE
ncbi:MAG: CtsR family transcriptional regulator [Thermoflavifilum sp.]|nr:CtsR family transcriptional regulator [Thermoflavifilum sp.]MCL6513578.1 CtsR family transcriptional regulator [Alicyclobacillus sp.]